MLRREETGSSLLFLERKITMKPETMDKKIMIVICLLFLFLFCTSVYGYFTDHHESVNEVCVGEVDIKLDEPLYELPENQKVRENLSAGDTFIKDPAVTNRGKSDCFVVVEAEIPRSNRIFIDQNGQKLPEEYRNLFTFTAQPEWQLLKEEQNNMVTKYSFAYAENNKMIPLKPGETTETLFLNNKVELGNVIELPEKEILEIPVKAYGIQTTDLAAEKAEGTDNPEKVYRLLMNQLKAERMERTVAENDL